MSVDTIQAPQRSAEVVTDNVFVDQAIDALTVLGVLHPGDDWLLELERLANFPTPLELEKDDDRFRGGADDGEVSEEFESSWLEHSRLKTELEANPLYSPLHVALYKSIYARITGQREKKELPDGIAVSLDFDGTITSLETLDYSMGESHIAKTIKNRIGQRAMDGVIAMRDSLIARGRKHANHNPNNPEDEAYRLFQATIEETLENIDPSITEGDAIDWFVDNVGKVFVVSGGFEEMLLPVTRVLMIPDENVLANSFTYFPDGRIKGIDVSRPTSRNGGKPEVVQNGIIDGRGFKHVFHAGDGSTDAEVCKLPDATFVPVDVFVPFRDNVRAICDEQTKVAANVGEVFEYATELEAA